MSTPRQQVIDLLLSLTSQTCTAADLKRTRAFFDEIDPALGPVGVLGRWGTFTTAVPAVLMNDAAEGTLLLRMLRADDLRLIKFPVEDQKGPLFKNAPPAAKKLLQNAGRLFSFESGIVFMSPPGPGGTLYELKHKSLTALPPILEWLETEVTTLRTLSPQRLHWREAKGADFERLASWPTVERLHLEGGTLTDAAVDAIISLPRLLALRTEELTGLTAKRRDRLAAKPGLLSFVDEDAELIAPTKASPAPAGDLAVLMVGKRLHHNERNQSLGFDARLNAAQLQSVRRVAAPLIAVSPNNRFEQWPLVVGVAVASAEGAPLAVSSKQLAEAFRAAEVPAKWKQLAAVAGAPDLSRVPTELFLVAAGSTGEVPASWKAHALSGGEIVAEANTSAKENAIVRVPRETKQLEIVAKSRHGAPSTQPSWRDDRTQGVLIAGRSYDCSELTNAELIALCAELDALGKKLGVVAVPADVDLSAEGGADDDEQAQCSLLVGRRVAEGGTLEPLAVARADMLSGLKKASALKPAFWKAIDAAIVRAGGELQEKTIALRLACTGPLPMATLAFGVLGTAQAKRRETFIHGQGPDQSAHAVGVWGVRVDGCSYDGSAAKPIDMGDAAHRVRAKSAAKAEYFLIARYD